MIYLGTLLFVIGCMALLDWRHRLFFFRRPVAATAVMVAGMIYFLGWDLWAIDLGIFLHRDSELMTGIMLAPELPLEEAFFLFFLSYLTMVLFTGLVQLLTWRAGRRGRTDTSAERRARSEQSNGVSA
ncbi:lycopene cyclase domain-containing protein [Micrococcus terreus]|uniref:lycopene cyclase domain-containing protein n=1 Tax=Micrococcus terreus TaxID=574650 RepID=UPI0023F756A8|nr:lycopene cyclase domain-containing protein [Micrococcus terreus]